MVRPVVLAILDGWGYSPEIKGNAIAAAQKPNFDFIEKSFPLILLQAAGATVGLPWGEPGNSEVGHIGIGTGQIWHQPLTRITQAIHDGAFFQNPVLKKASQHVKDNNSAWHIVGLLGSGSVHSYADHLNALVEMARNENIGEVWLHLFTDGQDSPPKEGATAVQNLLERLKWVGAGKISCLIGRFYSMDRDNHWDRIEKTYKLLVYGEGEKTTDFVTALKSQYVKNINDQYIEPLIFVNEKNEPQGLIKDNDAVIFFNYREDRARELAKVFTLKDFKEFALKPLKNLFVATLTQYESSSPAEVIFSPLEIRHILSEMIAGAGKTQFKIAETEKYAHVTYFFNGGKEETFPGEERKLIRSAATSHFNEVPEMKAREIAAELMTAIKSDKFDFLLVNFANVDMLGHTGDYNAVVKGVAVVDEVIGQIMQTILEKDGALLITADHGNGEQMLNPLTGEANPEHTMNPVPCHLIMNALKKERTKEQIDGIKKNIGGLVPDVAATVLDLMGIPAPDDMDSKSLLPLLYKQ